MVDIESNKTCISIGSPPESPISLKSSCVITFIPLYNAPSPVENLHDQKIGQNRLAGICLSFLRWMERNL